jgi:hypothetical protein
MLSHLRRPFVSGEIPSGHGSVFHFLDIFALGCGLEALAGLHKGDPLWEVAAWVAGALGFHLLGTKWSALEKRMTPRLAAWFHSIGNDNSYRIWALGVVVSYFAIGASLYVYQLRSDLDTYVMPRTVTNEQAAIIRISLMRHPTETPINVFANEADSEAMQYAGQLYSAVKQGGWEAHFGGINPWEPDLPNQKTTFGNLYLALDQGVNIMQGLVGQPENPDPRHPSTADVLIDTLHEAHIDTGGGGTPNLGKYSVTILVCRRPLVLRSESLWSQVRQWLWNNWIL